MTCITTLGADRLADQIVVIDSGRVIAQGSPDQLKAQVGGDRLDVVVEPQADLEQAADISEHAQRHPDPAG